MVLNIDAECLSLKRVLQLVRTLIKQWKLCSTESWSALNPLLTNLCSAVNDDRMMRVMIIPAAAANASLVGFNPESRLLFFTVIDLRSVICMSIVCNCKIYF